MFKKLILSERDVKNINNFLPENEFWKFGLINIIAKIIKFEFHFYGVRHGRRTKAYQAMIDYEDRIVAENMKKSEFWKKSEERKKIRKERKKQKKTLVSSSKIFNS